MSENSNMSKVGPDYFSYYAKAVKDLLSEDENFLKSAGNGCDKVKGKDTVKHSSTVSGSLFGDSFGARLPDWKKERLNALLRQAVTTLTPEVDEMLDPVVAMRRLQSDVRTKKSVLNHECGVSKEDATKVPNKKLKVSAPSSTSVSALATPLSPGGCSESHRNACGSSNSGIEQPLGPGTSLEKENGEADDDLQFLLENDAALVEEAMKKYSGELFTTLGHMEKQLEELLDTVVSTCRPMSPSEKRQLQKLIQKLPQKNLNRVAEIAQRNQPAEAQSADEILVDLEKKDAITLWRLYYYVESVEKARKLASSSIPDVKILR